MSLFDDPSIVARMDTCTTAQWLRLRDIVKRYEKTHPGLSLHQLHNYLRYFKRKAQLNLLSNDITGKTGDHVSQAIASAFPSNVSELNARLCSKVKNHVNGVIDPFTLPDRYLDGYCGNVTGVWGEWALVKHYYQQGSLITFSIPLSCEEGDIDLKISENVEKWMEVKNVRTTNQWGKALKQAEKYAQNGARHVILAFLQQGVDGTPDLSQKQLSNLKPLEKRHPSVKFEVRTGATDPSIRIPFDPPFDDNWGECLH